MIFLVFSIFDRVSGTFGEPFLAQKQAIAVRRFNYLMSNSKMVSEDCDLYCLGTFDTDTGALVQDDVPAFVCRYEDTAHE